MMNAIQKRLEHEYRVITEMGFEDYFLIVSDLIHYAKTHDVMVGPGGVLSWFIS